MKTFTLSFLITIITLSSPGQVYWRLDKQHGHFGFSVRYMQVGDYEGCFKDYSGKINSKTETDLTDAIINLRLEIKSVKAEDEGHEEMLVSKPFFDANTYPFATFMSTSTKPNGAKNTYDMEGDLTIKGVTKKVKFTAVTADKTVINPYFNTVTYGIKITGIVKRTDFGITGAYSMEPGGMVISDEVSISASLILEKQDNVVLMLSDRKPVETKNAGDCIGLYNCGRNGMIMISEENGKLFSKATGEQKEEIYPFAENKFFYGFNNVEIEFKKDASGRMSMTRKTGKRAPEQLVMVNIDTLNANEALFNEIGWNFIENKNYEEAMRHLKRGATVHPKALMIQGNLAHCYLFKNDYTSAIKIYKAHMSQDIAQGYKWTDMIKNDFVYFKNHGFSRAAMDKVVAELKLEMPEEYKKL